MSDELNTQVEKTERDPLGLLRTELDTAYLVGDTDGVSRPEQRQLPLTGEADATQSFLVFRLGEKLLACAVTDVERIITFQSPIAVPFIRNRATLGFASHYGQVAPLLDLYVLLRMSPPEPQVQYKRTILIKSEGLLTGIPATSVDGVAQACPKTLQEGLSRFAINIIRVDERAAVVLSAREISHAATEDHQ